MPQTGQEASSTNKSANRSPENFFDVGLISAM